MPFDPDATPVGECAEHERRRPPAQRERAGPPTQLVVRHDDAFAHIPVLRQPANGARAAKSVLRLLRRLDFAQRVERRVTHDVLRQAARFGERDPAAPNGLESVARFRSSECSVIDAPSVLSTRCTIPSAHVPDCVPISRSRVSQVIPTRAKLVCCRGGTTSERSCLDERGATVERREVDRLCSTRPHPTRTRSETDATDAVLEIERSRGRAMRPVAIEVTRGCRARPLGS